MEFKSEIPLVETQSDSSLNIISTIKMWYNGQPYHSLPTALLYADKLKIKQQLGSQYDIFTSNWPMPPNRTSGKTLDLGVTYFWPFFNLHSTLFSLIVLRNRCSYRYKLAINGNYACTHHGNNDHVRNLHRCASHWTNQWSDSFAALFWITYLDRLAGSIYLGLF